MLTATNLRKSFGPVHAVRDISFQVQSGEVFGLLGPNGAGKSTTIAMLIGLLTPDAGTVTLEGVGDPRSPAARAAIGLAPQSLAIYNELTARENLDFFARLFETPAASRKPRVAEMLELVSLTDAANRRAGKFSGGMKRRLNLACALIHRPRLLLLDEPTAGVDPQSRNAILETVASLRDSGVTILYTTHYMEEAQRLCDRVAIIDQGQLLALDTIDNLIASHGGQALVTIAKRDGSTHTINTADPTRELERVMAANHDLDTVRIDRPNLESVFLALTGRTLRD
ncbi:MAG: ABC transporter ATP-binding protein [Phycisphaerales bacterium]